jgi:hypothetical protein
MDGVSYMREMYRLRPAMPAVLSSGYNRENGAEDMGWVQGLGSS